MQKSKNKPDLHVYARVADGRTERIGPRIGVGFMHREKDGFTIFLGAQPLPLDGKIQLVAFRADKEVNRY